MCHKEEKPNLNHKIRVYVKILVYKNIAPHKIFIQPLTLMTEKKC